MDFYTYSRDEEAADQISYFFLTESHVYTVVFDPYQYAGYTEVYPHLLMNGVGLSFFRFDNNTLSQSRNDVKIASTICRILQDYFAQQSEDAVLLYHCDHQDNRQKGRSLVFRKWYNTYNAEKIAVKREVQVDYEGRQYFIGYITKMSNPLLDELSNEFDTFVMDIGRESFNKPDSDQETNQ